MDSIVSATMLQWNLSITDTLRPNLLLAIQRFFFFLRGKKLKWTSWNQNSLLLVQRFPKFRESFKRSSTLLPLARWISCTIVLLLAFLPKELWWYITCGVSVSYISCKREPDRFDSRSLSTKSVTHLCWKVRMMQTWKWPIGRAYKYITQYMLHVTWMYIIIFLID